MARILIYIILLTFPFKLISQNLVEHKPTILTLDTIIYDKKDLFQTNDLTKIIDERLMCISIVRNNLIFRDYFSNQSDTSILIGKENEKLILRLMLDIVILNNNLYILTPQTLYHFKYSNKTYKLSNSIDLEIKGLRNYENVDIVSGKVVLSINRYMKSPFKKNYNAKVLICDTLLKKLAVQNIIENQIDEFLGITSNYKWVCLLKDGLIFSEIGNYTLYYYSISENKIVQFDTNRFTNSLGDKERLKRIQRKYQLDPQMSILTDSLVRFEEVYNFIHEIIALNDSVFCVFYSQKNTSIKKYVIDYWKISNGKVIFLNSSVNLDYCMNDLMDSTITNNFQPLWLNLKKFKIGNSLYIFAYFPSKFNPVGFTYNKLCETIKSQKSTQVIFKYIIN